MSVKTQKPKTVKKKKQLNQKKNKIHDEYIIFKRNFSKKMKNLCNLEEIGTFRRNMASDIIEMLILISSSSLCILARNFAQLFPVRRSNDSVCTRLWYIHGPDCATLSIQIS